MRPAHLLRLAMPAAIVASTLVAVTGSSGTAEVSAEPRPFQASFRSGAAAAAEYDAKSVLVKFKPKATGSARKAALAKAGATADDALADDVVTVTGNGKATDLLKKVKADPAVEVASLDYIRTANATPNDVYYGNYQKYLSTVRANEAWDLSKSAGNQVVAVLDSGVDAGHPDLAGHLLPGYNTFNTALPPADGFGHGTMMTGIIAAGTNNSIGVAGVAWNAKVRPVKVLDDRGRGADSNIINGINWAVKNGARVINMSFSGPGYNMILEQVISSAVAKGVVVVAAAGGPSENQSWYPAAYKDVIAVGATNASGVVTSFSASADWVDIAAPGWEITSTGPRAVTPTGVPPYWTASGTSFSAAIVAGAAALVRNKWPALTPAQVTDRLKSTARDAGPRGIDPSYGAGIVDVSASLGGRWAPDFPAGAADGNDQPARATKIGLGTYAHTIGTEGDVDWYVLQSPLKQVTISVTGPVYDESTYPVNVAPFLRVYNDSFTQIEYARTWYPVVIDPSTGLPKPQALTATAGAVGTIYIAVSNSNGSRDNRPYTLSVTEDIGPDTDAFGTYQLRDVWPADHATNVPVTVAPKVTFTQGMPPDAGGQASVYLLNGRTGARVAATISYDLETRTATLTPTMPLPENTPFRFEGWEAGGYSVGWSSVFTTADLTPQKPAAFDASGAYLAANLAWQLPPTPDLAEVIVRRNPTSQVPTLTTGTLAYAGTASAVKNTGLAQGVTYTYGAWVKDRSGTVSPVATTQLLGMKSGISTSSTLINYGSSITLKGSTLRIDNKAYAGLPVNVYVRPKNGSKFTLLAALKTSSTGTLSVVHKPAVSSVYMLTFPGNADLMGTRTADITVQVAPAISAALAPSAIRLGQATAFSGYVTPAHSGQPVYLQQYSNRVWKSIASVKLSSSGKYAFGIKPTVRGQIAYRVWFPGDADHSQAYTVNKILTIS